MIQEMFQESSSDEDFTVESENDDSEQIEELNPFMFELQYNTKKWELIEAYYNQWLGYKPQYRMDCKRIISQLKKLKVFCQRVSQKHAEQEELRDQNEKLRFRMVHHDELMEETEQNYHNQVLQLREEIKSKEDIIKTLKVQHDAEIILLQNKMQEVFEENQILKQENRKLEEILQEAQDKTKNLEQQLMVSQKEIKSVKTLKMGGSITASKGQYNFSTFEIVMGSKVKGQVLHFLHSWDVINLCMASKRLYFSIIPLNVLMPIALQSQTCLLTKKIQMLEYQREKLQNLQNQSLHQALTNQIVKTYQLFYDPSELMSQALQEANGLISGKMFSFDESMDTQEEVSELGHFLKQISARASDCVKDLKKNSLKWSDFCKALQKCESESKNISLERQNLPKQLRQKVQEVNERLFSLGCHAATKTTTFSQYLSAMQRSLASLFTFSTQLVQEVKLINGLNYYMALQYWNVLEKDKILDDLMQRQRQELEQKLIAKAFLEEKLKAQDGMIAQKEERNKNLMSQLLAERDKIQNLNQQIEENQGVINNYSSNVKRLALSLKEQRDQNKELIGRYNHAIEQFRNLCLKVKVLTE